VSLTLPELKVQALVTVSNEKGLSLEYLTQLVRDLSIWSEEELEAVLRFRREY